MELESGVDLAASIVDLDDATDFIMALTLVGARIQAFLYLSPFFNSKAMMRTVRLGFVLALSILLVPHVFEDIQADQSVADRFLPLIMKEFLLGMVLGMIVWMPIRGLELTGVILDTQRGSTQAQGLDVVFGAQTTPTSIFLLQIFSGFFFAIGGFRMVQIILFSAAESWPFTATLPPLSDGATYLFIEFAGVLFFSAFVFALPISGLMVLADIVIAFVARSAPTLNALTFGMPVKSALLVVMLFFYMDIAFPRLINSLGEALAVLEEVLAHE